MPTAAAYCEAARNRRAERSPASNVKSQDFVDRTGWQSTLPSAAGMLFFAGWQIAATKGS
jgi:hypothetical protein